MGPIPLVGLTFTWFTWVENSTSLTLLVVNSVDNRTMSFTGSMKLEVVKGCMVICTVQSLKLFFPVVTRGYSEKIPSVPNRSRTHDLPITNSAAPRLRGYKTR